MSVRITLRYAGKTYHVIDELETDVDSYIWKEGNYSCDCNRSLFIQRQCTDNFPDMTCDHTIELVCIEPQSPEAKHD